jgi:hypothetical protein
MKRLALIGGSLLFLSGCYTVNNERFANDVRALVQPGMEMSLATGKLESNGFACDPHSSAPAITCVKTRQNLLPYTCIERVNLTPSQAPMTLDRVDTPPIACAGF